MLMRFGARIGKGLRKRVRGSVEVVLLDGRLSLDFELELSGFSGNKLLPAVSTLISIAVASTVKFIAKSEAVVAALVSIPFEFPFCPPQKPL